MTDMTDFLELELLDHAFGKAARDYTSPAVLALKLHTADPTETGGTGEVADTNGYARQAISFDVAAAGAAASSALVSFTASGGNFGTITHIAIADSLTYGAGNNLVKGIMTASKIINDGDTLEFAAAAITVSLD